VSTATHTITADQLLQMPDDGFRYELVKGALKKMTPAGFHHGELVANLTAPLAVHVKANKLGVVLGAETGFKIESNPDTVLAPDIAFVRQERVLQTGRTDNFWPGAPDLAVEVLSPSDTVYEVEERVAVWLAAGASMIWVLNPRQRTLHLHRPNAPSQTLTRATFLTGRTLSPDSTSRLLRSSPDLASDHAHESPATERVEFMFVPGVSVAKPASFLTPHVGTQVERALRRAFISQPYAERPLHLETFRDRTNRHP